MKGFDNFTCRNAIHLISQYTHLIYGWSKQTKKGI